MLLAFLIIGVVYFASIFYAVKFITKKYNEYVRKRNDKEAELRLQKWEEEQAVQREQAAIEAQKRQQEIAAQLKRDELLRLDNVVVNKKTFCESSKAAIEKSIISFFNQGSGPYHSLLDDVRNRIANMNTAEKEMFEANDRLMKEYQQNDQLGTYNKDAAEQAKRLLRSLEEFSNKLSVDFSHSRLFSSYGTINPNYRENILKMHVIEVRQFMDVCERILDGNIVSDFYAVGYNRLFMCMWFIALQTPFVNADFQRVRRLLHRVFRATHTDVVIADLYSKYNIGGEKAIYEDVKSLIEKNEKNSAVLSSIASGLMWMKAYESEQRVLQHMLSSGVEMSMPLQQRLRALANGGGETDTVIEISSADNFYFDVSPLAWKDNDFTNLFDNLAFQGKTLTYALAIRDEDKELSIPIGITVPSAEQMQDKLASVLDSEYEGAATSKVVDSVAISGSGEESLKGVLVTAADCAQMGILIHSAKIGRKLTIKLYTLFVPTNNEVSLQKKQVLSLYNKLSLSTTQWESSLQTTILTAIQQLLNDTTQTGTNGTGSNTPIF